MAHTKRTSARAHRLTSGAAVVAVALTTATAFARVFIGHGPTWKLLAAAMASAGVALAFERKGLILATVVSAGACAIAVSIVVFPESAWFGLPTAHTFHLAALAAGRIGQEARVQIAPTQPVVPLMLAAVVAVWAAVFSMHSLAVRTGSPLLGLLPPISLLAFADSVLEETVKPQYGVFFLVAALGLVFSDGLRRVQRWGPVWEPPDRARQSGRWSRSSGARRMGLACVAAAVLAPVLLPGFGSRAVLDFSSATGSGLDPLVSIRAQLNRSTPADLFRVRAPIPAYWRTLALDSFDGTTWRPEPARDPVQIQPDISIAAPGLSPSVVVGQPLQQQFTITDDLGSQWLPAAYPPSTVVSDTQLRYDIGSLSLSADGPLRQGTTYNVTSSVIQPTPEQLDGVVFLHPGADPRYIALPKSMPDDIAAIARAWTQGQANDYRKILAIENRLRSFTYDATVAPRDDASSMIDFLTVTKRGFCQQFASSMAVMLRTLGIPARVAVGFTPGAIVPQTGTRVVTTDDYHAWVEVLFPTYGWLAFEPTPGRSNPLSAEYAQPAAVCTGPRCGSSGGSRPGPGKPGRPDGSSSGQRGSRRGLLPGSVSTGPLPSSLPWGSFALAGGLALLIAALGLPLWRLLARMARGRRTGRRTRDHVLATYQTFTERAATLGYPKASGETLEQYRARVAGALSASEPALHRLTLIVSEAAYGRSEPTGERANDAEAAADRALTAMRASRSLGYRLIGAYRPARV